jgi:hypothetical protein
LTDWFDGGVETGGQGGIIVNKSKWEKQKLNKDRQF